MQERVLQRAKYIEKLNELFITADTSGDGRISLEEFKDLMEMPHVLAWSRNVFLGRKMMRRKSFQSEDTTLI